MRGRHSPRCALADARSAGCKRQRLKQQQRGEPVEEAESAEEEAAARQRHRKRKQGHVNLCVAK